MQRLLRLSALVLTVLAPLAPASAEHFPSRQITIISPINAGAPQDVILRAMAEVMAKDLGQPVIVENKPGAALTLGPASMAANAKPDGYTVSAVFSTLV